MIRAGWRRVAGNPLRVPGMVGVWVGGRRIEILCSWSSLLEAGLTRFEHARVEIPATLEDAPRDSGQRSGQDVEAGSAAVSVVADGGVEGFPPLHRVRPIAAMQRIRRRPALPRLDSRRRPIRAPDSLGRGSRPVQATQASELANGQRGM